MFCKFSGMALLGCDVISTDQVEVLPLLMRNVERNTSWIMQANPDSGAIFFFLLAYDVVEHGHYMKKHTPIVGFP